MFKKSAALLLAASMLLASSPVRTLAAEWDEDPVGISFEEEGTEKCAGGGRFR